MYELMEDFKWPQKIKERMREASETHEKFRT